MEGKLGIRAGRAGCRLRRHTTGITNGKANRYRGAHIPNLLEEGRPYTGTAQNAEREAEQLARNILAVLAGKAPEPFLFRTLGEFVNLGHRVAVAQIKFFKFSGLIAWMLWRATYLLKIPHWSRKARVLSGWTLDMLFGRSALETETPRLLRRHSEARRAEGEVTLSKPGD